MMKTRLLSACLNIQNRFQRHDYGDSNSRGEYRHISDVHFLRKSICTTP